MNENFPPENWQAIIPILCQVAEVVESPVPQRQPGHVLVHMQAAALNFADLLQAEGKYQEARPTPFVPGLEGAGVVMETAPGCDLAVGDRVAVWSPGTMTRVMSVAADRCIKIPDGISFEQAAGFQIAHGTSHLALTARAALRSGEILAVLGAAGGVGLTAVEIGRAMGARVIGIARGADKVQAVRDAGADHVIDSAECDDLKAALRALGGVDVVYDPVGDVPGLQAFGALKPGGRHLIIGFAGGKPPALPLNHALVKNIAIHGFYWGAYRDMDRDALYDSLRELFQMVQDGRLNPQPGHILPLDQIAQGYAMLRNRKSIGKIVITM
ncbi:NADPH:quinone oxidoreductase family protein [Paracoccus sp. (in: a-proteobacteria)]|uniref:NADPH:quinone oxidoreductase family protein n=1 Tax=Paracoccus sp. TaxID=267 RepID=UPI0026E0034B|nr:NADPH:quinone oxidoreductase family protein [Paracoccus sp. (in: a-proteobacteria)]MDO5647266.1 NADPH:quinone oxidoreductase family protein [Paracoccus sp. (in: a-proteobacteria)]